MSISIKGLNKHFGKYHALRDVELSIPDGELVALLGPSGGGKTTLLRTIAGLESPDSGQILFEGRDAALQRPRDRGVGFVFQHYALFRHMTVFENIAFGLRVKPRTERPSEDEIRAKVGELLKLIQLDWISDRFPDQLSGGQRQRVALARALAPKPRFLLLDEPFGALDTKVRKELRRWLRELHDELGMTSLFVTHDQDEALELADRVVVMMEGRVAQVGTPDEVYERPATPEVFQFLGNVNLFHGRLAEGGFRHHAQATSGRDAALAFVRPHDLEVERFASSESSVAAVLTHAYALGPKVRLELRRTDNSAPMEAELSRDRYRNLGLVAGDPVWVTPTNLRVFSADEDVVI
ncbi:MAG TPA: sulfate ABC transporter ATP-binding protein [Fibrobacteria bacterium]|nr:sulfate ABC transporter ATP-binding protein [Fibrobacteria bacterium]